MFIVGTIRELFSTLRFRIVLWITVVVFVMVLAMNTGVREIEHRALRHGYDDFLVDTLEEISLIVARFESKDRDQLFAILKEKIKENEYRSLFIQLFDEKSILIWGSSNATVVRGAPSFETDFNGPFDGRRHRIYEKKLRTESGKSVYVRCGFPQLALQEDIDLINRNILWASLFLVVLAPLGGYVIAWRATRPIAQVIATAAHLEPTKLHERLPIRGTGDEIDQLSRTINNMLDRLASFITQNRDFVANAAHELRSPLAAIRTSVEVGLNRPRTTDEYVTILSDVIEDITRLSGLVNQLLLLAEGDAGRLGGRNQVTRLEKLVLETVMMFDAVAEARGCHLEIGDLTPAVVLGDETHLRQVLRNLIDNAIKYNRPAGQIMVHLRVDAAMRQAILTIQDTGIGISREHLPRIFERFYRADSSRSRETERSGYGLGLSICKTIVTALDGDISVESEMGVGTTFTIRLPIVDNRPTLDHVEPSRLKNQRDPTVPASM